MLWSSYCWPVLGAHGYWALMAMGWVWSYLQMMEDLVRRAVPLLQVSLCLDPGDAHIWFSWPRIIVITVTKLWGFPRTWRPFVFIIWCEEVCACSTVWQEIAHHLAQEQRSPIPAICIQVQWCILLKTNVPSFLTCGLKRRLCRKPSLFSPSILSCFLLEQEVQTTAVQLLCYWRIVAQLGLGGVGGIAGIWEPGS